ncbi:hypothetical protein [Labilibacter marinus]|uniref:hypothetical protein n=1 Tax=Labilibacter marinus TaxID=1477105 RepID=UPI00117ADACC|nr:hypothetical protein [Labilibacter marinus]
MRNRKIHTLVIILFCFCSITEAKKLPGFIITEQNDTIHGEVQVHTFNRRTGAYVFSGIDLEWCYLNVSFRKSGKARFKYYLPEQLKGYHFSFEGQDYIFHQFQIQYKSLVNSECNKYQFLNLIKRTPKESIYRAQRYMMMPVNEVAIDLGYYPNMLVPEYNYYRHTNGNDRIIKHSKQ